LPCFIASFFAFVSVFLGAIFLTETSSIIKQRAKRASYEYRATATTVPVAKVAQPSLRSVMTPAVIQSFTTLACMAFISEMFFALYPLFAFTPIQSGGLGKSEREIGIHMAMRSINNLVIMLLYTPFQRRFGTINLHRTAMVLWPISVVFFPLMNAVARQNLGGNLLLNTVIGLFFTTWSFGCLAWTGSNVIVNDAAPSAEAIASVIGLSQMATNFPLALAPAFTTSLFAYSIKSDVLGLGGHLIWIVMFSIGLCGFLHSLTLREPTHDWRADVKVQVNDD